MEQQTLDRKTWQPDKPLQAEKNILGCPKNHLNCLVPVRLV